jgi:hypothetical protein
VITPNGAHIFRMHRLILTVKSELDLHFSGFLSGDIKSIIIIKKFKINLEIIKNDTNFRKQRKNLIL